jgi:hypothetical protein
MKDRDQLMITCNIMFFFELYMIGGKVARCSDLPPKTGLKAMLVLGPTGARYAQQEQVQ